MPISLLLKPTIDPNALKATGSRIEGSLEESGRRGGERWGALFGQGVEKSTPKIEAASRRVASSLDKTADAVGRARVAQERYDQLVRSGESDRVKLVASQENLARAHRVSESTARATATAMASLDRAQRDAAASASAFSALMQGIADGAAGTRIAGMASSAELLAGRLGAVSGVAGGAALGVAGVGVAAVAVTKQLYDLGAQWDDVADSITARTGAMGDDLDAITDSARRVAGQVAVPVEKVGDIAGRVSQSLHLTGQPLERMTQQIGELTNLSKSDVDVRGLGKLFRLFNVRDTSQMTEYVDVLATVSQDTAIPLNELISTMGQTGKVTQELGLSFRESAGLIATFEMAGVDAEKTSTGLSIAMKKFAADGREPKKALQDTIVEIKRLTDAGNDVGATALASKTFGKGYVDFLNAIKGGDLDVKALDKALQGNIRSVHDMNKATEDLSESWTKLKNTLSGVFAPAAKTVFDSINAHLVDMIEKTQFVLGLFDDVANRNAGGITGNGLSVTTDQLGGLMTGGVGGAGGDRTLADLMMPPVPGAGEPPLPLPTTRPGSPVEGLGPNFYLDWYGDGSGSSKSQSKHQYVDPSLFQVGGDVGQVGQVSPALPSMSPAIGPSGAYGYMEVDPDKVTDANNAVLQQRESLSEANLRLLQIQQDQNADQLTLLTAQNNVAQQKRSLDRAERELMQAQQGTWRKAEDTVKGLTSGMGQIGAALDSDLGISKGLPGIAENLTKFLANLAFAPMLGRLAATSAVNPNQGSGLLGSLASQGAFGAQYTPAYANAVSAAAPSVSAMGPPALQPVSASLTAASDAALLANVPAGRYTQDQRGDLTQGLADCSSAVEDLVNIMDGRPTAGASMYTGNAAEWLTKRGFLPGTGGPGDFRVGFNSGHMQATLPGGTPFNWGSDASAARRGIGGTGADDPAFTSHYYRPVGVGPVSGPAPVQTSAPIIPASVPLTAAQLADPALANPALTPASTGAGAGIGPGLAPLPQAIPRTSGGLAPSAGPGGEGAQGLSGVPMAAMTSAIGMGLDAMAPGAGAAAQTVSQLTNRFIGWMGQNVGIGVGGLMEMFLPHGSPLADPNRSWLGRFAAGFAGARPALPNIAGQQAQAAQPAPAAPAGTADAQGGAGGPQTGSNGQPITLNYNNYQATESSSGRDMVRILANTGPGR